MQGRTVKSRIKIMLVALIANPIAAQACIRPETPLPPYPDDPPETREIIKQQYLRYFDELQAFFKCLDQQRQDAFNDAEKSTRHGKKPSDKKTMGAVLDN